MAQALGTLSVTSGVRSRVTPNGICDRCYTLGYVFSEYYGFPLSLSFHQCFILIYSRITEQLTSSSNNAYKNNVSVCWGNMAHDQILNRYCVFSSISIPPIILLARSRTYAGSFLL
jgi:hypothetical protein